MKIHVNGTLDSILINKVNPDSISNTADIHLHGHVLWDRPNTRQILENLESEAKKKRKRTYVLVVNDDESPYPNHEWIRVMRTSMRKSTRNKDTLLPYIWECNDFPFSPYTNPKPTISFCGQSTPHRQESLIYLPKRNDINTRFIVRDKFWGGKPGDKNLVYEFNTNMQNAHFNLASRGIGNFSMRFYQTLAAGRIPAMIDTDSVLPFDQIIEWNQTIAIAQSNTELADRIANFQNLETAQRICAAVFHKYMKYHPVNTLIEYAETYTD